MIVRIITVLLVLLIGPAPGVANGQQSGDAELRDFGFFSRFRPKGRATPRKKPTYRRKGEVLAAPAAEDASIGVTFWLARAATRNDPAATREIVKKSDGTSKEIALARLGANAELALGEEFRIAIETTRTGFLYVINRSRRADGTVSAPALIFPDREIRGGDNRVRRGQLVMLPVNEPFVIEDATGGLVEEELIVIVSSGRLDVETRDGRYDLSREVVESWVRQWSAPIETYELEGGVGQIYTTIEKAAARRPDRLLTAGDPAPQVIQRVAANPRNPLLIRTAIKVRK